MKVTRFVIVMFLLLSCLVGPVWAKGGKGNGGGTTPVLTTTEADNLIYLREEEKLARDVYLALYDHWGAVIFDNIATSEQTHMDAVKGLIDKYGMVDPVGDNGPGFFENEELQTHYDDLIKFGIDDGTEPEPTLVDALKAGLIIENLDIDDIERMQTETDKTDIKRVLANLLAGSYNHLDAFTQSLDLLEAQQYILALARAMTHACHPCRKPLFSI